MSAVGNCAVLRRHAVQACLERAAQIRSETSGWWFFRKTRLVGVEEFRHAWSEALVEEASFEYSGYALGHYLDAQKELNGVANAAGDPLAARALGKAFTAAFLFDAPLTLPELPAERLASWCRKEFGEEGGELLEAIQSAHSFVAAGLSRVDERNVVAFVVR